MQRSLPLWMFEHSGPRALLAVWMLSLRVKCSLEQSEWDSQ